jgi:parallel beta-helix repeat protein
MTTKRISWTRSNLSALRTVAAFAAVSLPLVLTGRAKAEVIRVTTTIQAAINAAQPGDTVRVPPGTYHENVLVQKGGITIEGSDGAVMEGTGLTGDTGILVAAAAPAARIDGFQLRGLYILNYRQNGVKLYGVNHFNISYGRYKNNQQYGIFPSHSSNGQIELNEVSGANDTGIYIGQSIDVLIKHNHIRDCTVGVEVENSSRVTVRENAAVLNSTGILVDVLPGLDVTLTRDVTVSDNVLTSNNRPNPSTNPADLLTQLPSGIGLLNIGGDRVLVKNNVLTKNNSAGIAILQLPPAIASLDPRIDPIPDHNQVLNNVALHNGANPNPKLAPLPGRDLLWDGSGTQNCWKGNIFKTAFPVLPGCPDSERSEDP